MEKNNYFNQVLFKYIIFFTLFVKTFAHELGHAIGMRHDFSDKWAFACALKCIPCYDKEGQDCLKMKGIMSYEVCHFH